MEKDETVAAPSGSQSAKRSPAAAGGLAERNRELSLRITELERELARIKERDGTAHGLHDSVAQALNFVSLQLQMLEDSLRNERHAEAATIAPLLRTGVRESYVHLRALMQLFPPARGDWDLNRALGKAVQDFRAQTWLDVCFSWNGCGGPPLSQEEGLQILFIAQEALSNIRMHAQADTVLVSVLDGQDFSLSISDNGAGFGSCAAPARHAGLRLMRERARRINAELEINSRPGSGTTVRLNLKRTQPL